MMKRIILGALAFAVCLFWAEVKVEKVLETTSIKGYNQWVKKNKTRYPELRPYYLNVECIKWSKGLKISYYDEDGNSTKEELLKAKLGWSIYARDFPYQGVVLLLENDESLGESAPIVHTIKDKSGNKLFSFTWGFDYSTGAGVMFLPGGSGIFRSKYISNSRSCYTELLSWDGKMIGQLDNFCEITIDSKATPNGKYMALLTNGTIVFVENGKELWRKTFASAVEVGISNDGQFVCIGDAGRAYVYNRSGDSLYSYCFSPCGMSNPMSKFSSENEFLVLSVPLEIALIDNETGNVLWRKKVNGDAYKRQIFFASDDKYILVAYLGRVYIYDLRGHLLETIEVADSNNWEVDNDILIINMRDEYVLHKVIYKLK
jgi:hypothetical protein